MSRTARIERITKETAVTVDLSVDGEGKTVISTGVAFFDHLLESLGHHALFDLSITAEGDTHVDDHHTVEDTALCLGAALAEALGDRSGICRFGDATVPMDESRATAVVDLGGRPYWSVRLPFRQPYLGNLSTQNIPHAIEAFARSAAATIHVLAEGDNDHHLAEATFKALARSLRMAVDWDERRVGVPSTKGTLE